MHRIHFRAMSMAVIAVVLGINTPGVRAQDRQPDDAGYRSATGLLHRGMFDLAAAEYRDFLRVHPEHAKAPSARYGLAVCLTRVGKWQDAAVELDSLATLSDFEFAPDALLLRARCCVEAHDEMGAAERLERLLAGHVGYEHADEAAMMLGEARYRVGEPDRARRALDRIVKEWPDSAVRPRAELFLALVDIAEHRDAPAVERLSALRSTWATSELVPQAALLEAQCVHRLAQARNAKPDAARLEKAKQLYRAAAQSGQARLVPDALLGIAQLSHATGDLEEAGRLLDDLLNRFSSSPAANAARLERARVWLDAGKPDQALALLEPLAAAQGSPLAPDAAYWAAKCELKLARFDAAASRLAGAIERHPDSDLLPAMMFDRAVALSRAEHPADARRAYADVRTRFPSDDLAPEALAAEASLSHAAGDYDHAAALCRQFLDSYASHPRATAVELLQAENDALAGKTQRAEQEYAAFLKRHSDDPQAQRAAIRRGLALATLGQIEAAADALDAALKSPSEPNPALKRAATIVLADAAMARADWPAAEKWLRSIAESGESSTADALLKLGLTIQRQGRADEALHLFNQVVREHPEDPVAIQAAFERGQVLVEQGKLDEAQEAFRQVLASEENAPDHRFTVHSLRHLASIASRRGQADEAAALLARVAASPDAGSAAADALYDQGVALLSAGRYPQADSALERFLKTAPAHARAADARAQRAIAASRQGQYEAALALLDAAEQQSDSIRPEIRNALRYERAWALKELGRTDDARAAYQRVLADTLPPSLEAHAALDLAQLQLAAHEHASALELLTRAQTVAEKAGPQDGSPVSERALYLRAACQLKLDKSADAAATLDSFLDRFPSSELLIPAQLLAGQVRLKSGRAAAAAELLQRVVDADPPVQTLGPALLSLGDAQAGAQQWAKSQGAFEQYLKRFPQSEFWFQAQFGIAWAVENQGHQAAAISAYRAVTDRHNGPTAARAQFQIGECLFALKRYDEAARELLKVDILYAYPEWTAAALYEAGRCLSQLGTTDHARRQYRAVIDRFKDTEWARLAAQRLSETAPAPLPGRPAPAADPASR